MDQKVFPVSPTDRVLPVLIGLLLAASIASTTSTEDHLKVRKCESLQMNLCQGQGYNVTGFPNFIGHESQADAEVQLRTFTPLIQYGCSPDLKFFLCAVYAPMCTEKVVDVIGPCRSVCEKVRERCEPTLHRFGFSWPNALDCSKFIPKNRNQDMCMEGPTEANGVSGGHVRLPLPQSLPWAPPPPLPPASTNIYRSGSGPRSTANCQHLQHPQRFVYNNRTQRCLLLCNEDFRFARKDKNVMDIWLAVWSIVALLATVFVVVTFLIDADRFAFAERHVIFMTTCYGMCSVSYLVRVIAGRGAISCVPLDLPNDHVTVLGENGSASTDCTILFVLLYYFLMAGIVWWLVVTFNWMLVAGINYGPEVVQRLGTYFHIAAWTTPAVKVVVILIRKNVEPNEFTGMCHVSSGDSVAVVGFLLAPMSAYFCIGVTFLVGGLLGRCQQRKAGGREGSAPAAAAADVSRGSSYGGGGPQPPPSSQPPHPHPHPCLLRSDAVKVATFSAACALPLIGMIACVFYGYVNIERPRDVTTGREDDVDGGDEDDLVSLPQQQHQHSQSVSVFLIEILMTMLVTIFTAVRLLQDADTKRSWKEFLRRRRCSSTGGRNREGSVPPSHLLRTGHFLPHHAGREFQHKDAKQQCRGLIPSRCDSRSTADRLHASACRTCKKQQQQQQQQSVLIRPMQYVI